MQKAKNKEKGSQMLEFALVTLVLVPFLLGVVVIGLNLGRSVQVAQIGRDAGSMFVRGVDFSQTGNQDILIRLSQGLGMTRAGGTGVVILSKVTFIPSAACAGINPCNSDQYVVTQRIVVGNATLRSSSFGPAGSVTLDSYGNVANYMIDANAVATAFGSVLTLNANEFAYVSETYFPSPSFDMPGFETGTGVYARAIF
jgi:hypothetical protein